MKNNFRTAACFVVVAIVVIGFLFWGSHKNQKINQLEEGLAQKSLELQMQKIDSNATMELYSSTKVVGFGEIVVMLDHDLSSSEEEILRLKHFADAAGLVLAWKEGCDDYSGVANRVIHGGSIDPNSPLYDALYDSEMRAKAQAGLDQVTAFCNRLDDLFLGSDVSPIDAS